MDSTPRLTSEFWVKAYIRRCATEGVSAFQVRRGDATSGTILIKLNRLNGDCTVLARGTLNDGRRGWLRGSGPTPVPDTNADQYIERQSRYDSDLWVIEVEDPQGRHFLDEPVEN